MTKTLKIAPPKLIKKFEKFTVGENRRENNTLKKERSNACLRPWENNKYTITILDIPILSINPVPGITKTGSKRWRTSPMESRIENKAIL